MLVSHEIYSQRLPRIVLQQLVENSITHGYRTPYEVMEIRIEGGISRGRWYIKVSDNGDGFEAKVLEQLLAEKENVKRMVLEEHRIQEMEIGGMGLLNIYSRMLLLHHMDFEMDFYNSEKGAVAVLYSGMQ